MQTTARRLARLASVTAGLAAVAGATAADHKEAPLISEDPAADIADVYAFASPDRPGHVVLAMTVNPFTVPSENIAFRFSSNVRYRFEIDLDNDGVSERTIAVTFDADRTGFRVDLPGSGADFDGVATLPTVEPFPTPPVINEGPSDVRVFAGPTDDPFFFDFVGFSRFLAGTGGFTGSDAFAGENVSAIVIEAPIDVITGGPTRFQVWGATDRRQVTLRRASRGQLERSLGPWEQVERMGNPAVATALIPSSLKDLYNIGEPADDAAAFAGPIVASLTALGTDAENIGILASVAVPDTLKVDLGAPTGFPNGRAPADDVIDTLFFFIFNQPETPVTDGVGGNDRPFDAAFPYLAPAQQPGAPGLRRAPSSGLGLSGPTTVGR